MRNLLGHTASGARIAPWMVGNPSPVNKATSMTPTGPDASSSLKRESSLSTTESSLVTLYLYDDDHIVPFGVEANGALGPSAKALLRRIASNVDAAPEDIRSARYRY